MIGFLRGIIINKKPPILTLDVNGVGYELHCAMSTFYQLPDLQQSITLLTHLNVREDAQLLFGFINEQERKLFRALIKVNGIGPKLALTILSGIAPDQLIRCIQENNSAALTGIPGIGSKTAARLLIETRDVLKDWQPQLPTMEAEQHSAVQDAMSALIALGYKSNEANKAVAKAAQQTQNREELIRLALQYIMKGAHV